MGQVLKQGISQKSLAVVFQEVMLTCRREEQRWPVLCSVEGNRKRPACVEVSDLGNYA